MLKPPTFSFSLFALLSVLFFLDIAAAFGRNGKLPDRSREGITPATLWRHVRILRPQNARRLAKLQHVSHLDWSALNRLHGKNFRAAIFDIDETLAPHHGAMDPQAKAKLVELARTGVFVATFSNASSDLNAVRAADLDELEAAGIVVLDNNTVPGLKGKPAVKAGFGKAFAYLNQVAGERGFATLRLNQVVMFGDDPIADGASATLRASVKSLFRSRDKSRNVQRLSYVQVNAVKTVNYGDRRHPFKSGLFSYTSKRMSRAYGTAVANAHDLGRLLLGRTEHLPIRSKQISY